VSRSYTKRKAARRAGSEKARLLLISTGSPPPHRPSREKLPQTSSAGGKVARKPEGERAARARRPRATYPPAPTRLDSVAATPHGVASAPTEPDRENGQEPFPEPRPLPNPRGRCCLFFFFKTLQLIHSHYSTHQHIPLRVLKDHISSKKSDVQRDVVCPLCLHIF
jgi:hypothetical protein